MRRMLEERVIAEYKNVAAEPVNRRMAPDLVVRQTAPTRG